MDRYQLARPALGQKDKGINMFTLITAISCRLMRMKDQSEDDYHGWCILWCIAAVVDLIIAAISLTQIFK